MAKNRPTLLELSELYPSVDLPYGVLLLTQEWQRRRFQILERDRFGCRECSETQNTVGLHRLHVHHRYYVLDKSPWQYPDEALTTLCSQCHFEYHEGHRVPWFVEKDGQNVPIQSVGLCRRCHGIGWLDRYHYFEDGVCFACYGTGGGPEKRSASGPDERTTYTMFTELRAAIKRGEFKG